ncbi:MAG: glycerol kinase GlpK, partial [Chthoniobacterales bacterium]
FQQHFPQPGLVEHDAKEIWESVKTTVTNALKKAAISARDLSAIGITNQRETAVIWDKKTGEPLHHAIVWQDRRTAPRMKSLHKAGHENFIQEKTGLLLDAYFSGSKFAWLLDNIPGARKRAEAGELALGTIDSWLIFKLSGGKSHITDITNASRTMLMNLHTGKWDDELLHLFNIPHQALPEIVPNSGKLATVSSEILGCEVPISGVIGDQQSALFAQLCKEPGQVKCTYGTGCFMLMNVGDSPVASNNRLLSTVAWQLEKSKPTYALEGSVFVGGSAIQWLRDGLGIISTAPEVNDLAAKVSDADGVVLVPAFTGLGAPYWDSSARGALLGISRGTSKNHLAFATLEGIAFQVTDLLGAMEKDSGASIPSLRVDGGAAASDLLMQMQADQLGTAVERPTNLETTALGAAYMAGLGIGAWASVQELHEQREVEKIFKPQHSNDERKEKLNRWHQAVKRAQNWEKS